jgi:hypothetical protein
MASRPRDTVNATEIRVVGMSRSGNHAIVDWILAQVHKRSCQLNCAEPQSNPFRTARPLSDHEPGWRMSFGEFDVDAERAGCFASKDLLIHSLRTHSSTISAIPRRNCDALSSSAGRHARSTC